MVFEEIAAALAQGEPVRLHSFGSFKVRSKRGRVGRNPKTGVELPITPRRVATFKASPLLVARINGGMIAGEEGRDDERAPRPFWLKALDEP
jgi:integration host factor subunit alpha